jgi:hypothetical protein
MESRTTRPTPGACNERASATLARGGSAVGDKLDNATSPSAAAAPATTAALIGGTG